MTKKPLSIVQYKDIYMQRYVDDSQNGESWEAGLYDKFFSKEYEEKILAVKNGKALTSMNYDYDLMKAEVTLNSLDSLTQVDKDDLEKVKQKYKDFIDEITMRQALE